MPVASVMSFLIIVGVSGPIQTWFHQGRPLMFCLQGYEISASGVFWLFAQLPLGSSFVRSRQRPTSSLFSYWSDSRPPPPAPTCLSGLKDRPKFEALPQLVLPVLSTMTPP